jgi:ribosome-associated translation inhibitor RaiA
METLSFVLGMALVVVIAIAIVAIYAFVKVRQVKQELQSTQLTLSSEIENVYRVIHDEKNNMYSSIDSRLDKLESKLTNNK